MEVRYKSTRDSAHIVTASQAILQGLAPGGGLYVPTNMPQMGEVFEGLVGAGYHEVAYEVMHRLLSDFTEEELRGCIARAYDEKFDTKEIAPLVKVGDVYYLELFHGSTIAFKDMALSILPHLMITSAKKNEQKEEIVILTATSGDTGKAALAGFADVPGTRIIVFYPSGGVSRIQELQMLTTKGENTTVVSIDGNFDDAQTGVKRIFEDEAMREEMAAKGFRFSSANSINIGRLVPQIVYYVYGYLNLVSSGEITYGEKINVTVPTGNFGNILAAYYAKKMGLPIDRLICASNRNKVLFDFFTTGTYDRNRDFYLTSSPSMDILISSNLERLIYEVTGEDSEVNAKLMRDLNEEGRYSLSDAMRERLAAFYGGYADEEQTTEMIRETFENEKYVLDPHTAVAGYVYREYKKETGDDKKTIIASTASPYKFTPYVMQAIAPGQMSEDVFELIDALHETSGIEIPKAVREIRDAKILHDRHCPKEAMADEVRRILGLD